MIAITTSIIALAELVWAMRIIIGYGPGAENPEVFISRASLQDVVRARDHFLKFFFALQLASIFSIGRLTL
jgi:hypothetical protein